MASEPLRVAILWHQHQPYYKLGNRYLLPWTRLHATKDYIDVIAAASAFPSLRQTVNVVPSLLIQLLDYAENGATDLPLELSRIRPEDLDDEKKVEILRYFFLCNVERMVLPYPRYRELYERAGSGERNDIGRLRKLASGFAVNDWLDLQVWYNLTWIGPYAREREPFASLLAKGRDFTEQEKHELLEASLAIVRDVVPTYRRMLEEGSIELSVTPFYHPILPILCDSYSALEALPNMELPVNHISLPEDARTQIERGVQIFHEKFGRAPEGMWPSEGSVSDAALALIRGSGITWTASDEGVLKKSLGEAWGPISKYFPYSIKTRNGPLWMLFRDHELSDAIGFVYSSWEPEDAALDFYNRLVEVRTRIIQEAGAGALVDAVVPVILDGENCWEYYSDNGRPFLEALYRLLSESNEIVTTTFCDTLRDRKPHRDRTLGRIFSGSWIGTNFKIWIGHDEDNRAWDALIDARNALQQARENIAGHLYAEAMEEIYIAEGSDWFWWFGDENSVANQDDFDELFRSHLRNVYTLIGQEPPAVLDVPIRRADQGPKVVPPAGAITPSIDGRRTSNIEWADAGHFVVEELGGAMHRADAVGRRFWFGRDQEHVYLRYDPAGPLVDGMAIRITLAATRRISYTFTNRGVALETAYERDGRISITGMSAAVGEFMEIAVAANQLAPAGEPLATISIVCETFEGGHGTERFPQQGELTLPLG
jgi:alpha-amylase/alpha-mannosidase (GH57 family)